MRWC